MFTDADVIRRISTEFVPFAGNTNELQVGKSPERDWFMSTIKTLHPGAWQGVTAQGFYVVGADGTPYAYDMGARAKDAFMKLLDRGLEAYKANPPKQVEVPASGPIKTWTLNPPEGTLVVRTVARVRPIPEGSAGNNANVGQDHYWLMPSDMEALLANPQKEFAMPRAMAYRLARFHLVDFVRGEPDRWRLNFVRYTNFRVKRAGADALEFSGGFKMVDPRGGKPEGRKGYEGRLEGRIEFNPSTRRATSFVAFADGMAWGEGSLTSGAPKGRFPLKIAFRSVDDEVARSVPPQLSYFWAEYADPLDPIVVPWP